MTSGAACKAVCVLMSDTGNNVLGQLTITQPDVNQPVKITGNLTGLTPGKHGLSVCVAGNLTQGAASCGPIFNPFGTYLTVSHLVVSVRVCRFGSETVVSPGLVDLESRTMRQTRVTQFC
jgi:Cu/Zn superoxide dismutase